MVFPKTAGGCVQLHPGVRQMMKAALSWDGGHDEREFKTRLSAAVDWWGDPAAHLAMKDKPLRYPDQLLDSRQ